MNRREVLGSSTAAAAGVGVFGWPDAAAAQTPTRPIGIQVGVVSFFSRKYSEMRLDNLRAAGRAVRETIKGA